MEYDDGIPPNPEFRVITDKELRNRINDRWVDARLEYITQTRDGSLIDHLYCKVKLAEDDRMPVLGEYIAGQKEEVFARPGGVAITKDIMDALGSYREFEALLLQALAMYRDDKFAEELNSKDVRRAVFFADESVTHIIGSGHLTNAIINLEQYNKADEPTIARWARKFYPTPIGVTHHYPTSNDRFENLSEARTRRPQGPSTIDSDRHEALELRKENVLLNGQLLWRGLKGQDVESKQCLIKFDESPAYQNISPLNDGILVPVKLLTELGRDHLRVLMMSAIICYRDADKYQQSVKDAVLQADIVTAAHAGVGPDLLVAALEAEKEIMHRHSPFTSRVERLLPQKFKDFTLMPPTHDQRIEQLGGRVQATPASNERGR